MTTLSSAAFRYLDEIDASGLMRSRVEYFVSLYDALYPDGTFTEVFASDSLDEENSSRAWTSLWFYGESQITECKDFLFRDNWDSASIGSINHWGLESEGYAPDAVTDSSRMILIWSDTGGVNGRMTATGSNCSSLTRFLRSFLVSRTGSSNR